MDIIEQVFGCCTDPQIMWVNSSSHYSTIIPAVATLFAALFGSFLGPWFAFKLQKQEREQKIKQDEITAGNHAIFTVMCQYSRLEYICKQVIDPFREHPLKFIAMRAVMPPIEYEDLKYDMNSLSFLLKPQTSKQLQTALRETLAELFNVYEKFQTTVSAINNRTEFHVAKAQPLLERANVHLYPDAPNEIEVGGQKLPIWEKTSDILRCLENVLGHRIYQILLQSTEQIINSIDDTKESLLEMRSKLIGSMNQLFPENAGDILHFEPK